MSHPFVTSNSQEQMFSVKRAIHSIRKIGSARGLQSAGAAVLAGSSVVGVGIVGAMFDLGSWTESGRVAVKETAAINVNYGAGHVLILHHH